jgi:hypothetical protein
MPAQETVTTERPSDDLTVVLLRGNGSPRSFRFSLKSFNRAVTALGFTFAIAVVACVVMVVVLVTEDKAPPPHPTRIATPIEAKEPAPAPAAPVEAPVLVQNPAPATPAPPQESSGGLWGKIGGGGSAAPAANEGELQKEVEGLRKDIAGLGAKLEGRKDLPAGLSPGLLQFFGPNSTVASESFMQVKNPKVGKDGSKQITVDFELHNTEPNQRQVRGYIVVIAKSADTLVAYPAGVFAPAQNILLDYTKGETFAVSRFRQGHATFPAAPLDGKKVSYQVLLFGTDGKVLTNLAVEDKR